VGVFLSWFFLSFFQNLWFNIPMITNDASNNSTAKNIFLAAGEPTLKHAQKLLRKLQHEAGRGTTESDFARLEKAWETDQLYM
jgi:hypothetical protein